jgi:hypothetical protein
MVPMQIDSGAARRSTPALAATAAEVLSRANHTDDRVSYLAASLPLISEAIGGQ